MGLAGLLFSHWCAAVELVSTGTNDVRGEFPSLSPSVSGDGRFVVSVTKNVLVHENWNHVYLKDRQTHSITLVSRSTDGGAITGRSASPRISADGKFVVFVSATQNLVAAQTGMVSDIFVRDLEADTTACVAVAANGDAGDGDSNYPSVSADGSVVAFGSTATNFVQNMIV